MMARPGRVRSRRSAGAGGRRLAIFRALACTAPTACTRASRRIQASGCLWSRTYWTGSGAAEFEYVCLLWRTSDRPASRRTRGRFLSPHHPQGVQAFHSSRCRPSSEFREVYAQGPSHMLLLIHSVARLMHIAIHRLPPVPCRFWSLSRGSRVPDQELKPYFSYLLGSSCHI
jgi:hypothetical protein